jgi:two-component system, LytTR family, response regulator
MNINVIIVDDEPLAINVVKNYVSQIKELHLVKTFRNALKAATFLQENSVDIVFLDIHMPVLNGFDFMESLTVKPFVVITTAHEEYALKCYELQAIAYLVKPIPFPSFVKVVNRICGLIHNSKDPSDHLNANPSIYVKVSKKKMQKVYLEDILVVESMKDYILIKTLNGNLIVHQSLTSFTDELPESAFIRIHRSYTVAIEKIKSIEANKLEINGVNYAIGRQYAHEVKRRVLG